MTGAGLLGVVTALQLIDFDEVVLIEETMAIGHYFKGAFNYHDLRGMEFDRYEVIRKRVQQLMSKKEGDDGGV